MAGAAGASGNYGGFGHIVSPISPMGSFGKKSFGQFGQFGSGGHELVVTKFWRQYSQYPSVADKVNAKIKEAHEPQVVATRIAVRLMPDPPEVRTMLADFMAIDDAAAAVSAIIAAGIVPAALEMMDAQITRAVEDFVGAGFPRDAEAVLLVEVAGLPHGVEIETNAVERVCRAHGARNVRVATDPDERALLWKGRKSAFGAVARIAPDYYLHDAVVPRTKLVEVIRKVYEISDRYQLIAMNVFHAGDGNLHPLLVFDGREPGIWDRVHAAGDEILRVCIDAGGVLSGEHGIGLEKRDAMSLIFDADDLDLQACIRDAFDPDGIANPEKILPKGSRCGEIQRVPEGAWI